MNGIHDNGETKGLDKKRFDTMGVVRDIVIDRGGVFVGVAVPNWREVVFDEGPEDGGVLWKFSIPHVCSLRVMRP